MVAVVPAFDEEGAIGAVVDGDPRVRSARSTSSSSTTARPTERQRRQPRPGAAVVRLPFNLGIGAAVQTGFRYALERDYDVAVRLDGDGQHVPGRAAEAARSRSNAARRTS